MSTMDESVITDAQKWKEEGNKHYKAEEYDNALAAYTKALELNTESDSNKAVYYKNRAACYLKLENYANADKDASAALEITPADTKALFRKCQALEHMGNLKDAFTTARKLNQLDPKNNSVQQMLRRLGEQINEKIKENASTNSKVEQMFKALSTDEKPNLEKQRQAAQNLVVLAREEAGAEKIYRENGIAKIKALLQTGDEESMLSALRVLSCLCKGHRSRATAVINEFTLQALGKYISSAKEELANAAASVLLTALKAMIAKDTSNVKNAQEAVVLDLSQEFKNMLLFLLGCLTDKNVSGYGRDAVIDIIIKFVPRKEGTGRALTFLTNGGLNKLLSIACQLPELKRLPITPNTRMHTSVCMDKLYDEMRSDKNRQYFSELCNKFISQKFGNNDMNSNMEALNAISALLQGPFEVGNELINKEGVMQVMVAMAASRELLHQRIALETIINSASKKDKCTGVLQAGVEIMKKLYQSKDDHIRVRALVGLCKIGSAGGSDAGVKILADGSNVALSHEARRFLKNAKKDHDLKKWAAEGLAYLSLDADVKEEIVNDAAALRAIVQLSQTSDQTVLYPIVSMFVNLTNSYDNEKPEPELVKLAQFAKQHIPEEHKKDAPEFVKKRVKKLMNEGIVTALVALSKTDSTNSRELLGRVYHAIAEDTDNRGFIVQQGGAKALLPLALEGNIIGKSKAAQALARIAISMNPEIAFPGQRSLELVKPLLELLDVERSALENFEALMALTNLAGLNDSTRNRIMKEQGLSKVENYMWEEHELLKRSATQCMCNLVMNEQAAEMHCFANDRVKLLTIYLAEEDPDTVMAAAGALAILSGRGEVVGKKILTCACPYVTRHIKRYMLSAKKIQANLVMEIQRKLKAKAWLENLQNLCAFEDPQFKLRAVHIIANMIDSSKEVATAVVETSLLEIIMALSLDPDPRMKGVKERVDYALKRAAEMGLIKPKSEADAEVEEED